MNLLARLKRLETQSTAAWERYPHLVCIVSLEDPTILEDGSALTRPWVGRPLAELETGLPADWPLQVLVGINPLVVLGLRDPRDMDLRVRRE